MDEAERLLKPFRLRYPRVSGYKDHLCTESITFWGKLGTFCLELKMLTHMCAIQLQMWPHRLMLSIKENGFFRETSHHKSGFGLTIVFF